jgi:hypothetical protein
MNLIHKDIACKRLRGIGLSQSETFALLDSVQKWADANGEEWTIKRLKSIKVAYIHKLAGNDKIFSRDSWISHNKRAPKGPFKRLFNMKKPQKALAALMVYTQYTAKEATKSQLKKFETGVTSKSPSTSQVLKKLISYSAKVKLGSLGKGCFHKIESWFQREVRVPVVVSDDSFDETSFEISFNNKVQSTKNSFDALVKSASHPLAQDWMEKNQDDLPIDITALYAKGCMQPEDYEGVESIVGRIGFIQEPGYKLRVVANPYPIFQVLLSRFGTQLYDKLKDMPEDCTFNQDKAVEDVQEFLNGGGRLMSIDLSSATDRFPLDLQLAIAEEMGARREDIELFAQISRSEWQRPDADKTIRWEHGQPLGNFPSFGLFALSHHALVQYINPKFYRILGDDIVIDHESGIKLRAMYGKLHLPISEDKSIDSALLAEFGGRLITKDKTFIQPKWKVSSDRNFIELARNLGPKSISIFQPRQQKILRILADIPREVHPWGLNWNLKGLPYQARLNYGLHVMQDMIKEDLEEYDNQTDLKDLKLSIMMNHGAEFPMWLSRKDNNMGNKSSQTIGPSFETRVLEYLKIPRAQFTELNIPENWVYSTFTDVKGDPRGTTTLEVAERKLKRPSR